MNEDALQPFNIISLQETAEEADANDAAGPETEGEESDD